MHTMKKIFILLGSLALLGAAAYAIWLRLPTGVSGILWQNPAECVVSCTTPSREMRYGAYDPQNRLAGEARLSVNHIFLSQTDDNEALLAKSMATARTEKRVLFISLEPWPDAAHSKDTLLKDVTSGLYDTNTRTFCNALGNYEGDVWLSWGHEMDHDLTERYPWSHREPAEFIAAYRHFVEMCRPYANHVQFIWSPVGNKNTTLYWPGPDVVDMIGVPVYSYPALGLTAAT
jgi:cellulose synthase (UDP-forming)